MKKGNKKSDKDNTINTIVFITVIITFLNELIAFIEKLIKFF